MGFSATLDAILQNLPNASRQTLLFSATQVRVKLDSLVEGGRDHG